MSEIAALLLLVLGDAGASAAPPEVEARREGAALEPAEARRLLELSDLSRQAPHSFRLECLLVEEDGGDESSMRVEVWRRGRELSLVRFLGESHAGKFLLRRGDETWFLAPGSRRAIRLEPRHRLHGNASLDDLLGLALSTEYEVLRAERTTSAPGSPRELVFDLKARSRRASHPRVRHLVDEATGRPIETISLLGNGREAVAVRYESWREVEGASAQPARLTVHDRLHGRRTRVELGVLEERELLEELFSLEDHSARESLERGGLSAAVPR